MFKLYAYYSQVSQWGSEQAILRTFRIFHSPPGKYEASTLVTSSLTPSSSANQIIFLH